jgi:TorA maturation chaperone TorD
MSDQAVPMAFSPMLIEEDRARADYYALLAGLYYRAPDAAVLGSIAGADDIVAGENIPLSETWRALKGAAAAADAGAVKLEYDAVFIGTGKASVTLYCSHYLADSMKEKVLVRLRDELAGLGLARRPGVGEYEDHFAGLCEVMRHLIMEGSTDAALQKQKRFYNGYISRCYSGLCESVLKNESIQFYKHVARFTRAFLDVEEQSFAML